MTRGVLVIEDGKKVTHWAMYNSSAYPAHFGLEILEELEQGRSLVDFIQALRLEEPDLTEYKRFEELPRSAYTAKDKADRWSLDYFYVYTPGKAPKLAIYRPWYSPNKAISLDCKTKEDIALAKAVFEGYDSIGYRIESDADQFVYDCNSEKVWAHISKLIAGGMDADAIRSYAEDWERPKWVISTTPIAAGFSTGDGHKFVVKRLDEETQTYPAKNHFDFYIMPEPVSWSKKEQKALLLQTPVQRVHLMFLNAEEARRKDGERNAIIRYLKQENVQNHLEVLLNIRYAYEQLKEFVSRIGASHPGKGDVSTTSLPYDDHLCRVATLNSAIYLPDYIEKVRVAEWVFAELFRFYKKDIKGKLGEEFEKYALDDRHYTAPVVRTMADRYWMRANYMPGIVALRYRKTEEAKAVFSKLGYLYNADSAGEFFASAKDKMDEKGHPINMFGYWTSIFEDVLPVESDDVYGRFITKEVYYKPPGAISLVQGALETRDELDDGLVFRPDYADEAGFTELKIPFEQLDQIRATFEETAGYFKQQGRELLERHSFLYKTIRIETERDFTGATIPDFGWVPFIVPCSCEHNVLRTMPSNKANEHFNRPIPQLCPLCLWERKKAEREE